MVTNAQPEKKKSGFAALSPEMRREIARRGGLAAHASGAAYRYTSETARIAGLKSQQAGHSNRWTIETARAAGAKGGAASAARRKCMCEHQRQEHSLRNDACIKCDCLRFNAKNPRKNSGLSQAEKGA